MAAFKAVGWHGGIYERPLSPKKAMYSMCQHVQCTCCYTHIQWR